MHPNELVIVTREGMRPWTELRAMAKHGDKEARWRKRDALLAQIIRQAHAIGFEGVAAHYETMRAEVRRAS